MQLIPVILSGGSGTRLWPMSRALYPKQLMALVGEESLLQQTVRRARRAAPASAPVVVCNHEHRFQVAEQLRALDIDDARILLEPCARNTAPAIALAALEALSREDDPVLLVLPSDHRLTNVSAFADAVATGLEHVASGALVTFGIRPDRPATGYGYILAESEGVARVGRFTEKPELSVARQYLENGLCYWNSGMFLFGARAYLGALSRFAPEILAASRAAFEGIEQDLDFLRIPEETFAACPGDSIDYAVMEKTDRAVVVPLNGGWSDVGSWETLWEVEDKDAGGNVTVGDVFNHDSSGCYLRAESRLVGVVGLTDCVVVETADAVLVAPRKRSGEIKHLVDRLKAGERGEAQVHKRAYRPWGSQELMHEAGRFKVNRLTVRPGSAISLQVHRRRAEHWVVVQGRAKVICGDREYFVDADQSTFIPPGQKHRLENAGTTNLEVIEVQSGEYLGEDDIARFKQ